MHNFFDGASDITKSYIVYFFVYVKNLISRDINTNICVPHLVIL